MANQPAGYRRAWPSCSLTIWVGQAARRQREHSWDGGSGRLRCEERCARSTAPAGKVSRCLSDAARSVVICGEPAVRGRSEVFESASETWLYKAKPQGRLSGVDRTLAFASAEFPTDTVEKIKPRDIAVAPSAVRSQKSLVSADCRVRMEGAGDSVQRFSAAIQCGARVPASVLPIML